MGAVWAESWGDIVPFAGGDARQWQVQWVFALDEEMCVPVFFDGEKDKVIFAAIFNDRGGRVCGAGGAVCDGDESCFDGLRAAKQKDADDR